MASDVVEAAGSFAKDSGRVRFSDDMLTAIDSEHMDSAPPYQIDLGASGSVEVSSATNTFATSSRGFYSDTMEHALPSNNNLSLDNFETPNFQWNEGEIVNGYWQFTSLDDESFLNDIDQFPSGDAWWHSEVPSSLLAGNDRLDDAIGLLRDHFQHRSRASSPMKEESRRSWYSAPPRLQVYDEEIVNVFLNVARLHLSSTFPVFSNFEAGFSTREELCLAMAAVGALFCNVQGSYKVAKVLYNDARKMHLEKFFQAEYTCFSAAFDSVKTFILLALYGICSGDKRSYELWEAFYVSTLQTAKTCWALSIDIPSSETKFQLQRLSEALQMMESLRVLLSFRPPSFASLVSAVGNTEANHNVSQLASLKSLLTPGGVRDSTSSEIWGAAAISSYAWMIGPRGHEVSPNHNLWKSEFIELGLDRWIRGRTTASPPAEGHNFHQTLLYHLTHLNMHSNLELLQRLAHDPTKSAHTADEGHYSRLVLTWVEGEHFRISQWHAETILRLVKESQAASRRRSQTDKDESILSEPPHLPYCVYFATLIIWYGLWARDGQSSAQDAHLDASVQLLFSLRAHVSKILGHALLELSSDEN